MQWHSASWKGKSQRERITLWRNRLKDECESKSCQGTKGQYFFPWGHQHAFTREGQLSWALETETGIHQMRRGKQAGGETPRL